MQTRLFYILLSVFMVCCALCDATAQPMSINSPQSGDALMPMSINSPKVQVYPGNNSIKLPGIAGNHTLVVSTNFTLVELMLTSGKHLPLVLTAAPGNSKLPADYTLYYALNGTENGKVINGILALCSQQGQHFVYTEVW